MATNKYTEILAEFNRECKKLLKTLKEHINDFKDRDSKLELKTLTLKFNKYHKYKPEDKA